MRLVIIILIVTLLIICLSDLSKRDYTELPFREEVAL